MLDLERILKPSFWMLYLVIVFASAWRRRPSPGSRG